MSIKFLSIAAGLLGTGGIIGWAITADHYSRKTEDLEERVAILRRRANNVLDEHMKNNALYNDRILELEALLEKAGVEFESTFEKKAESEEDDEKPIDEEKYEETRSNLQNIINQYVPTDSDTSYIADAAKMEEVKKPPFVISRESFAWDEGDGQYFDKITLTYYPRDRMLLDDEEEPITDVANLVGWKNLNRFGDESGDPDTIYVRNERLGTDFEVLREEEGELPLHVKYGMGREEFAASRTAGIIRLRPEDRV